LQKLLRLPSIMFYVRRAALPNAVSVTIGSRRRALSRRLRLYRNDSGRWPTGARWVRQFCSIVGGPT